MAKKQSPCEVVKTTGKGLAGVRSRICSAPPRPPCSCRQRLTMMGTIRGTPKVSFILLERRCPALTTTATSCPSRPPTVQHSRNSTTPPSTAWQVLASQSSSTFGVMPSDPLKSPLMSPFFCRSFRILCRVPQCKTVFRMKFSAVFSSLSFCQGFPPHHNKTLILQFYIMIYASLNFSVSTAIFRRSISHVR